MDTHQKPRHTRLRSGIQVSAANAFGFYDARCSAKLGIYGSPIELGMTGRVLRMVRANVGARGVGVEGGRREFYRGKSGANKMCDS